jgi:hypothetical protein
VGQSLEHGEALVHDAVVRAPVEVGHHADATSVVFVRSVVEAGGHRFLSDWGVN